MENTAGFVTAALIASTAIIGLSGIFLLNFLFGNTKDLEEVLEDVPHWLVLTIWVSLLASLFVGLLVIIFSVFWFIDESEVLLIITRTLFLIQILVFTLGTATFFITLMKESQLK